jgi:hypothetical protein
MTRKKLFLTLGLMAGTVLHAASSPAGAVTVSEDDQTFTLASSLVRAMVAKSSGERINHIP